MSKKFFPKTLSDWLFLIFVLVLGAECHSYSRHRRAERRRARDMRSVERDYPVIRQEGTLRLIAGNDFLSDDQSEIYDAAIQELARDLRQKSGLRVEIIPPDSIDLQFKPLGQLSTGKVDLFVYSSIYDAAIDNREYRHFAEKRAASLYLVQRHADSTRYISQLSALAGHALPLPRALPPPTSRSISSSRQATASVSSLTRFTAPRSWRSWSPQGRSAIPSAPPVRRSASQASTLHWTASSR